METINTTDPTTKIGEEKTAPAPEGTTFPELEVGETREVTVGPFTISLTRLSEGEYEATTTEDGNPRTGKGTNADAAVGSLIISTNEYGQKMSSN